MSAFREIQCLRCMIRRLRSEIIALDGTPPPACCVVWLPGAPASFVIRRLRCQVKALKAILAGLEPVID